jgi:hypothetical protein
MEQLKLGHILNFVKELKREGMTDKEIKSLPIYLGDDDELNGIHCGWYTNLVDADDTEDEGNVGFVELINERRGNYKLEKGKAILIS